MIGSAHVLVIDDEAIMRDSCREILEKLGCRVKTAENGEEGLHRMTERRPDAITLDITMPLKTGIRLYREIKKSVVLKDIPVIIVTGITSDFEKFISTRRTVPPPDGYVHKPVDQQKLLCLVERLTA